MRKMSWFFKILLSFVFIGSFLFAQKVTQLKFVGLVHLSESSAKEVAGIRIGDMITAGNVNESIKSFFAQGYFKDVSVEQKGGTLIYHFKEKMAIANIEIKGYGSGDDSKELLAGMALKKGDLYDERRVRKAKKALVSKLEAQGFYDTLVKVSTKTIGENSIAITFDVNKGEKIIVKKMNFVGAKSLDKSELQADLASKEKDTLGWMPWRNSGEATVGQLEYDAHRLKNTYMENGFLDVTVSKPLMRVDFGSYNAEVDYQIHEGVQYKVGSITITHKIKGLDNKSLESKLLLKEGKIFNVKRMRKDIQNMEESVGNYGFAYVKVSPQMNKNPNTQLVDLNYIIQPGEAVTIKDVIISGNTNTKDRVIRRYIYLAPGDKFNARDLKDSKSALGRTGFFEQVDIQSQRITGNQINLLVNVKEASTGTISAGGGYGSYEGLMVNASISDKNLFGSGINTTLGFEISQIATNYNLSFVNPKVWDSMYSMSLSVYKRDYEYIDYSQDQLGASVSVGKEFYRYVHASLGLGYVDNQSTINENADNIIQDFLYNDQYEKTSVFTTINYNNTDDYYVPREGVKASLNFEFAQLAGDDVDLSRFPNGYGAFTKTSAKVGAYYGMEDIIDYDLIFRAKGRYTYISREDGEKLPTAEKLFMGGIGSVRGYDPYSLSPSLVTGELIGGTDRFSASLEASIPLSKAAKMRLAAFYDYGVVSLDSEANVAIDSVSRSSAGVVLEWQSAFGPINLVFAYPLDEEVGDRTSTFEFSMGTKF
ncbi:Outer membrane protein assembly factor YaeT precursor [hydrothermal vent metagenome]|uniref:Outer membrane protein assembly factor YaeT n=1 Tax=hydrothermal vent metagenome TaxID=652676 RepID=A0A1W1CYN7_9ZZZZ